MTSSLAILICNLGTPTAPTPEAVRAFLKPFLSDPRVVEIPRPLWWIILNAFILPFRPKPVSKGYQSLWREYGDSPLRLITQSQVTKLQEKLNNEQVLVDYVFSYGEPSLNQQIDKYRQLADKILLLPMYPQYSCSTTSALYDQLADYNKKQRECVDAYIVKDYYRHPSFRRALAESVQDFWQKKGQGEHLLISYHGVPKAYRDKGDPYWQQCLMTSQHLAEDLGLASGFHTTSFQSRLGKAEWLKPYTDKTVQSLAEKGVKVVDVVCPSFSVDCLETLEEIAVENKGYFTEKGGHELRLIPCLNDSPLQIALMHAIIKPFIDQAKQ